MAGALIVTAELAREDFAWLDRLRRAHFPPDRNHLSAHLTMFHALPPSTEPEVRERLRDYGKDSPPRASIPGCARSPATCWSSPSTSRSSSGR